MQPLSSHTANVPSTNSIGTGNCQIVIPEEKLELVRPLLGSKLKENALEGKIPTASFPIGGDGYPAGTSIPSLNALDQISANI